MNAPPAIVEWTAVGVLAAMFGVVLRWMMTRFERSIRQNSSAILASTSAMLGLQQMMLVHDLTVSGVAPTTGEKLDQRAQKALRKYEELDRKLTETRRTIEKAINSAPSH